MASEQKLEELRDKINEIEKSIEQLQIAVGVAFMALVGFFFFGTNKKSSSSIKKSK